MHGKLDRSEDNRDFIDWLNEYGRSDSMKSAILNLNNSAFNKVVNNKKL